MDLTPEQCRDIDSHRYFFRDAEHSGWIEFLCTDPGLPIRLEVPESFERGSTYNGGQEQYKEMIFDSEFFVVRTFLARTGGRADQFLLRPLSADYDWSGSRKRCQAKYEVGLFDGAPNCFVYSGGAVRVWFLTKDNELWNFEQTTAVSDDHFRHILRSARLLNSTFFADLAEAKARCC